LLQKKVEELQAGVKITSISPDVQELLQNLLCLPQRIIAQHCILQSLAFDKMHSRFDNTNEAHFKTFRWIFEDQPQDDDGDHPNRVSFIDWLGGGDGIFHIAGKLGSGKSTLIKFLCEHHRTIELLNKWAGKNKKLVFGQFFFWRAGVENQKSLSGLRRSILYDILEECSDLIPSVLPQQWERMISPNKPAPTKLHLSKKEILEAFEQLIQNEQLYKNHRFCFFIDGLDEYEESCEEDYKDMADQLVNWTKAAPADVKLCVSSRDYEVFRKVFGEDKRLRLQDLTRKDIGDFVRERLKGIEISKKDEMSIANNESLVEEIIDRADGIFLWVALVLKSLREGSHYDNRFSSLLKRVKDMPQGMEPLFQHLLDSINPSDHRSAYRTLAIVLKLRESDMSLFRYTFLEDYENDADFAMDSDFKDSDAGQAEISSRMQWAPRRLNGQCKGLLEARSDKETWRQHFCSQSITFAHRSIYDFVGGKVIRKDMEDHCKNFDTVEAICQSFLAELKFCGQSTKRTANLAHELHRILELRKLSKRNAAPFCFLENLQAATLHVQRKSRNDLRKIGLSIVPTHKRDNAASVFHLAAFRGYVDYVSWKITKDPTLLSDEIEFARIYGSMIYGIRKEGHLAGLQFLVSCLRNGVYLNADVGVPWKSPYKDASRSLWIQTLLAAAEQLPDSQPSYKRVFGELLYILLRSGEDPTLRLQSNTLGFEIDRFPNKFWRVYSASGKKTLEYIKRNGGKAGASLHDLVDFWQLENAVKLKELMDPKLESQPEASNSETPVLLKADSEQECKPDDQHAETEPAIGTDEVETSEPPLTAISGSSLKEHAESQGTTELSPNNLRKRLDSIIRSPWAKFAFGACAARESRPLIF
jgi:hypothetical protein